MLKRVTWVLIAITAFLVETGLFSGAAAAQETIGVPARSLLDTVEQKVTWVLDGADSSGRANREAWFTGDFLFGFMRGAQYPTLATSTATGTPRNVAGIEGASGTGSLFGGGTYNDNLRPGFRLGAGWSFGGDSHLGLEAGVMFLSGQTTSPTFTSDQHPILGRPYFDANTGLQQAVLVAYPGLSTGSIDIYARNGNFISANVDFTEKIFDEGWFRSTAIVGYKYYRYDETLGVHQFLTPTDPNFVPGTYTITNDSFQTRNEFHGIDMGFRNNYTWGRFSLEVLGKLAVGDLRRQVIIAGDQTVVVPGAPTVTEKAGVLALSSNSSSTPAAAGNNGAFIAHDWKVVPEFGVTMQWQVRPNVNVRLGYSFLLLNGVVRAGDQIDRRINPNLFPPALPVADSEMFPKFGWNRSDVWIQSINVGAVWNY